MTFIQSIGVTPVFANECPNILDQPGSASLGEKLRAWLEDANNSQYPFSKGGTICQRGQGREALEFKELVQLSISRSVIRDAGRCDLGALGSTTPTKFNYREIDAAEESRVDVGEQRQANGGVRHNYGKAGRSVRLRYRGDPCLFDPKWMGYRKTEIFKYWNKRGTN